MSPIEEKRLELLEEFYEWAQGHIDSLDIHYDYPKLPRLISSNGNVCSYEYLDATKAAEALAATWPVLTTGGGE